MNRFNRILITVFSLAALMFACNDNNDPVTPGKEKEPPYIDYEGGTDFWFPKEAGDTVIAVVDVNGAYRATVAEGGGWCTVSDIAVNSFVIHYEENKIAADRKTKITLSLEGVEDIEIVVSQRGPAPILTVDSAKFLNVSSPYIGGDTAVSVNVNGNYRVEVEAGKEWCRLADLTDINFVFGASSATVQHQFRLNISQNSELESRSAKVTVSVAYRDSTVRFEFVVSQLPTPILLVTPANESVIEKATGFPYTFSWKKTGAISSYSIAVSTGSDFTEETTTVITVGDVDSYALKSSDIAGVLSTSGLYKIPLYWKVMPTDPDIDIATETKVFYIQRKLITSYPLSLIGGESSWTTLFEDNDGYPKWLINAGQSSRRTWISTFPIEEAIEGKIFALAYDYKTSNRSPSYAYDEFYVYHYNGGYDGNWTIDSPGVICTFTDEWLPIRVPLTATREWGAVGSKATLFVRPMVVTSNDNSIQGMYHHVKDLRVELYEE
jgi:hypothetical protein